MHALSFYMGAERALDPLSYTALIPSETACPGTLLPSSSVSSVLDCRCVPPHLAFYSLTLNCFRLSSRQTSPESIAVLICLLDSSLGLVIREGGCHPQVIKKIFMKLFPAFFLSLLSENLSFFDLLGGDMLVYREPGLSAEL